MPHELNDAFEGLDAAAAQLQADVLVVGAGAAGCALAKLLSQSGRSVTLVERSRVAKKDKLCGGVLVSKGQHLVAQIYGPHVLDELGAVCLDGMRVLYRDCETTIRKKSFRVLPRAQFDAYLLEQAISAGAELVEHTSVIDVDEASHVVTLCDHDTNEERQLSYGVLVAADGALSTVRKLVTGRHSRTIVSLEAQTVAPTEELQITQRAYPAIAGGCWLIPQGPRAVIGCLFFPDKSNEPVGDQREKLQDFANELGCSMQKLRGAPVPTGDDILLRSPGGTFFIGDAAGLIEPSLGAGIHLALESAVALANALLASSSYEDAMASEVAYIQEKTEKVFDTYLLLGVAALMARSSQQTP